MRVRQLRNAASSDGITIDLPDGAAPNWWAHVHPTQYSGTSEPGELELRADTAAHVAGTFKISTPGVTASIVFDAPLIKTFPK